ncbi:hypothetical protein BV22DRAFT_1029988, partial [Leucogyrophana mollusca]
MVRCSISVGANEGTHDYIIEFRKKLRAVHPDVWIEERDPALAEPIIGRLTQNI